jgi:hypothetical protein
MKILSQMRIGHVIKFVKIDTSSVKRFLNRIFFIGGIRLWVTFISLAFVGSTIVLNSEKFAQIPVDRLTIFWLLLAVFISFISLLVNAIAWKSLLFWLGYSSNKVGLISLYLSSNLLKYLPGGIWHFVERLRVLKSHIGSGKALVSVLLEPLLMVSAALLFVPLGGWKSGTAVLCLFPAIFLAKRFREPLIRRLETLKASQLRRISRASEMSEGPNDFLIARDDYPFSVLILEMLFVLLRFFGFWFCLYAFSIQSSTPFFQWLAAFSLAWCLGLVVPGAPGGIGVFEASILIIVGSSVPESSLIAALLCYRLVSTIVDLIAVLFVSLRRALLA